MDEPRNPITRSKLFEFKKEFIKITYDNASTKNVEIIVLLKCFSNCLRMIELPLLTVKLILC